MAEYFKWSKVPDPYRGPDKPLGDTLTAQEVATLLNSLQNKLGESLRLLSKVAWYECEIGALANDIQDFLTENGIDWENNDVK